MVNLLHWQRISGEPPENSILIYGGNSGAVYKGIKILPWTMRDPSLLPQAI
jgi:hypothetical protein